MPVAEVGLFEPGTVVSTSKSRGFLHGSDVIRRTVVGNERGGFVPVGFSENGNGRNQYYTPVSLGTLDKASHEKGVKVEKKPEPSIEERNITKLWNFDPLWDETPSLKEGTVVWATFDNDERIQELSLTQPEDKSSGFRFGDNGTLSEGKIKYPPLKLQVNGNHLYATMNRRVPSTIHYQLEVFNWLVSTIGQNRKAD